MKLIKLSLAIILINYSVVSNGQDQAIGYFEDVIRFGATDHSLGSSARIQGIGGTQFSLGGDISSAATNPAGLGFFNRNVFTVSPSILFNSASTDYFIDRPGEGFQGAQETFNNQFNIANIGAVFNWNKGRFSNDPFKGGSLGISLSRSNSYAVDRSYQGRNNYNSLADALADQSFNSRVNDLNEASFAAFDQFLIGQSEQNGDLIYTADFVGFPQQSELIEERGSHYSLDIGWGGNYDDRLYFGGGLGLQFLNYRQNRIYEESNFGTFDSEGNFIQDQDLDRFVLEDDLEVQGTGVHFNFGVIARPFPFITFGAKYTSPTFTSLREEFFLDLDADWKDGSTSSDGEDRSSIPTYLGSILPTDYTLRSPARYGLGSTIFLGKKGFLSGDLEFVDYSNAVINSNDFAASGDNEAITNIYRSVMNIRLGAEYRMNNFAIRGGYAYLPSPFQFKSLNEQTAISAGFGYRTIDYFIDFSVVHRRSNSEYFPYEYFENQPIVTSDLRNTVFTITWGINF
ncbi:MAG: hypothetical protein AAF616_09915 [Bacteroidota bacterium]